METNRIITTVETEIDFMEKPLLRLVRLRPRPLQEN
jgi:hypothetical protein